jgi:hypothetical protein
MYLHHVKHQTVFTARNIIDNATAAHLYYADRIPANVIAERDLILAQHNYTPTAFHDELSMPRSFYDVPSDDFLACNREIAKLMRRQFIINSIANYNMFTSHISNAHKRNILIRHDTKPYTYHINPQYVNNPNFPEAM